MFHGFSVDNLNRNSKELRYDETNLCEVVWNVKLKEMMNKATEKIYYMAEFSFEEVKAEDLATLKAVQQNINEAHGAIYRQDTRGAKTLYSENWGVNEKTGTADIAESVAKEEVVEQETEGKSKATPKAKAETTKKEVVKATA